MDLEKYKQNPKTAYLAKTYLELEDEESKQMILAEMDRILEDNIVEENDELPNEIVLEVRAGAGGEEASLFAKKLAEMYILYAGLKNWSTYILYESLGSLGGYKEAAIEMRGKGVYENLRFETGVHRIQR